MDREAKGTPHAFVMFGGLSSVGRFVNETGRKARTKGRFTSGAASSCRKSTGHTLQEAKTLRITVIPVKGRRFAVNLKSTLRLDLADTQICRLCLASCMHVLSHFGKLHDMG